MNVYLSRGGGSGAKSAWNPTQVRAEIKKVAKGLEINFVPSTSGADFVVIPDGAQLLKKVPKHTAQLHFTEFVDMLPQPKVKKPSVSETSKGSFWDKLSKNDAVKPPKPLGRRAALTRSIPDARVPAALFDDRDNTSFWDRLIKASAVSKPTFDPVLDAVVPPPPAKVHVPPPKEDVFASLEKFTQTTSEPTKTAAPVANKPLSADNAALFSSLEAFTDKKTDAQAAPKPTLSFQAPTEPAKKTTLTFQQSVTPAIAEPQATAVLVPRRRTIVPTNPVIPAASEKLFASLEAFTQPKAAETAKPAPTLQPVILPNAVAQPKVLSLEPQPATTQKETAPATAFSCQELIQLLKRDVPLDVPLTPGIVETKIQNALQNLDGTMVRKLATKIYRDLLKEQPPKKPAALEEEEEEEIELKTDPEIAAQFKMQKETEDEIDFIWDQIWKDFHDKELDEDSEEYDAALDEMLDGFEEDVAYFMQHAKEPPSQTYLLELAKEIWSHRDADDETKKTGPSDLYLEWKKARDDIRYRAIVQEEFLEDVSELLKKSKTPKQLFAEIAALISARKANKSQNREFDDVFAEVNKLVGEHAKSRDVSALVLKHKNNDSADSELEKALSTKLQGARGSSEDEDNDFLHDEQLDKDLKNLILKKHTKWDPQMVETEIAKLWQD